MPAVHQHAKLHAPRTAEIKQAVHRGANGAAGIEDIVHQHQIHVVHGKGNVRSLKNRLRGNLREIVAVKSDVQRADGDFGPVYPAYPFRDALRQRDAAPANSNQRSEEHTSELQSRLHLVCRLLLEKKKKIIEMLRCMQLSPLLPALQYAV